MLTVTERAKEELRQILTNTVDHPLAGLRLTRRGPGHFALIVDVEEPGDVVVKYEGLKVLLIEEKLVDNLEGITLDIEDTPDGPKLTAYKEET
jgi:Fe-S cluster assembly iron-binding protein IscA